MRTRTAFIVFVVCIAWSVLHSQPAKLQDRMVTDGDRRFCENFYYPWRDTALGIGIPEIDRLCFDAQVDRP